MMLDMAEDSGADRIAVGHTANDQAETVLLWMLRGAGLTGLSGMPVARDGKIIRPLLNTTREDILAYLARAALSFREDSSNAKPIYMRNRIRQELMPILTRLAPSSVRALCRLAEVCREDDSFLDQQVAALCASRIRQDHGGGWAFDRSFLQRLPRAGQRRVVRDLLRRCDVLHRSPSFQTVERFLQAVTKKGSASGLSAKSARLLVESDLARFIPTGLQDLSRSQPDQAGPTTLTVPGEVTWAGTGWTIRVQQLSRSHIPTTARGRNWIVVDADRVSGPLVVRSWRPGDRFHPYGMKGRSKKLQDFFTDLKLSVAARGRIPVVIAPEGIVWIVGYRQDDRWGLTDATERCLVLTAYEESRGKGI
jgi:tRNA(Ile)-lysidine synthase